MKQQLEALTWKNLIRLHKDLEGGGIGDYARRNKAGEIELVLKKFSPEQIGQALDRLSAAPKPQPQAEQPTTPQGEPVAKIADVESYVREALALPLPELRQRLSDLIEQANKPAQIVEKVVEVPVEKIVEKIVNVASDGKQSAALAEVFIPKIQRKSAKDVFGIELLLPNGLPVLVDVYNDPDAPAVEKAWIWDRERLRVALTAINRRSNVWLAGPRGTGKTKFVEQICAALGRSFWRVNFNGATERTEVLGGDVAKGGDVVYREGVILQGIRRAGAIILLDEVGFARPEYLSALHALLEVHGSYTINETGESVNPAQGVVFFAADNSTGFGDRTGAYAGLKRINSAFLDRFARTDEFQYMEPTVEARLVAKRTGIPRIIARHLCDFLKACREKASMGDIAEPPSLRQAIYWAEALQDGIGVAESFRMCIVAKTDPDSHEPLQQTYNGTVNPGGIVEVLAGREKSIPGVNYTEEELSKDDDEQVHV